MKNSKDVNSALPESYELEFNPFPAAAAGVDIEDKSKLYVPDGWKNRVEE
ncbi:unnamed protein product, partial [marine sediment metagenome]